MNGKYVILILAILLGFLHQDFWNWDSDRNVFGFMPIGLFYHACYSLVAATLWFFAIKFASSVDSATKHFLSGPYQAGI